MDDRGDRLSEKLDQDWPHDKNFPIRDDFDEDDWNSDSDEEVPEMEKLTHDSQGVLPKVFPAT